MDIRHAEHDIEQKRLALFEYAELPCAGHNVLRDAFRLVRRWPANTNCKHARYKLACQEAEESHEANMRKYIEGRSRS